MWKLEPLSEENKQRWNKELNWFLSPTNYMVELVPAVQNSPDGCTMEVQICILCKEIVHTVLPLAANLMACFHLFIRS